MGGATELPAGNCKWNEKDRGPTFFVNASLGLPSVASLIAAGLTAGDGEDSGIEWNPYIDVMIQGKITLFMVTVEAYLKISKTEFHLQTRLKGLFLIDEFEASVLITAAYGDLASAGFRVRGELLVEDIVGAILRKIAVVIELVGDAVEFIFKDDGIVHSI